MGEGAGSEEKRYVPGPTGSRRELGHLPPQCPALPDGAQQQARASLLQRFQIPRDKETAMVDFIVQLTGPRGAQKFG